MEEAKEQEEGPRAAEPQEKGPPVAVPAGRGAPAAGGGKPRFRLPRLGRRRVTPRSVAYRIPLHVVRAFFFLVAAGLGIQGARTLSDLGGKYVSPLDGMVVACTAAAVVIALEALLARSPIRTISAVTFGLLIGLILSLVFSPVVEVITKSVAPSLAAYQLERLLSFFNLLATAIFCYFGVAVLLATRDDFKFLIPYVEFRKELKSQVPLILDTSVFIDGRIQGLLAVGLLEQRLEVPRFVLDELQGLADQADRTLRERGRRGMDVLHDLRVHQGLEILEHPLDAEGQEGVDAGLLHLAAAREGKLVTTDHNLTKLARLHRLPVLNINELVSALKLRVVPGERIEVRLLRAGEEPGQAVGFLDDGTMVVVEGARDRIGQELEVEVTGSLQTSAGKMVFGRPARPSRREKKGS